MAKIIKKVSAPAKKTAKKVSKVATKKVSKPTAKKVSKPAAKEKETKAIAAAVKEANESKPKKKPGKKEIDAARKGDSELLCNVVVEGMKEKKATDIVVIDLRNLKNAIADFFVVCSGNSDRQLEAISDSVDDQVFKKLQENPWHTEGKNNKEWMLLDYITVVAHVFKSDRRQYYALEKLWGDAEITSVED